MKKQLLNDALSEINAAFVYEAKFSDNTKIIKFKWKKVLTAAACFALVVLMIPAIIFGSKNFKYSFYSDTDSSTPSLQANSDVDKADDIVEESVDDIFSSKKQTTSKKSNSKDNQNTPIFNGSYFTAAEVASFFGGYKSSGRTTAYKKVYYPKTDAINLSKIPTDKYVTISHTSPGKKYNKAEFENFVEQHINPICDELNTPIPNYEIIKDSGYNINFSANDFEIHLSQGKINNLIIINKYPNDNSGNNNLVISGITVMVDQRLTDSEIINSLLPLRNKLSKLFESNFVKTTIYREYSNDSNTVLDSLTVNFYNDEKEKIQKSINISFDNIKNYDNDIITNGILYNTYGLSYIEEREPGLADNIALAKVKRISLEQAEELLKKGYTYGGNGCPICQSNQDPIEFDKYDYVGFEYYKPNVKRSDDTFYILPFYTFYKYLNTSENGKLCYAKTYVPAFEVSGVEEYFANKHNSHSN